MTYDLAPYRNRPLEEFGALIMAIHHADQKQLPILVVGAGLPSLVKLSVETRSYAERLFEYPISPVRSPLVATNFSYEPSQRRPFLRRYDIS